MQYKSWIEIAKDNLVHNFNLFKKTVGKNVDVCCVVKANGYGHGLKEVVGILSDSGAEIFAVDNIEEAIAIFNTGIKKKIIILGYIPLSKISEAIKYNFSFVVYNKETLEEITKLNFDNIAKIHLKIETGLNRQGIQTENLQALLDFIKDNYEYFEVEGVSTHFSDIEDSDNLDYAKKQIKIFDQALEVLKLNKIEPRYIHSAATAAAIAYPDSRFNMIRVGVGLYGLHPSKSTQGLNLLPVLTWKSIIAQVKKIKKGEFVSYGRTWVSVKPSKIAIVPVGYSDGYDRKLSNRGRVLVNGKYANVLGRVAMNMIIVDVTDIPGVKVEDEVILLGKDGNNFVSAEEIAGKIDTINYEVVARINPLIPKVII